MICDLFQCAIFPLLQGLWSELISDMSYCPQILVAYDLMSLKYTTICQWPFLGVQYVGRNQECHIEKHVTSQFLSSTFNWLQQNFVWVNVSRQTQ
jgi:hypothetical protein